MIAALSERTLTVIAFSVPTVVLLVWVWLVLRRPRGSVTAFTAGDGAVTISRKALQDVVARTCESFPEIIRARVRVTTSHHKVRTQIRLHLRQSARIRDFSDRLRKEITGILTGNLGIEEVGSIELMVAGIAFDGKKKPPESALPNPTTNPEAKADPEPGNAERD